MVSNERNVVIVGASAAGLRFAARLRRLEPKIGITVVEQDETFSWAACGLPYVLSGDIEELERLRRTPDGSIRDPDYFLRVKGFTVLTGWRAIQADSDEKTLTVSKGSAQKDLGWDDLVLATGATPRPLPNQPVHPRVCHFHSARDLTPLQSGLEKGEIEKVIIVGAGLVGVELTEAFSAMWGAEVTLVEVANHPLPRQLDGEVGALASAVLQKEGVTLMTGSSVGDIEASKDGVKVAVSGKVVEGDIVVVAVGVCPSVALAKTAGCELGPTGAIKVTEKLETSVAHIFAVGDCIETEHAVTKKPCHMPLGSLANRQGRTLAGILSDGQGRFGPISGAASVKIFDTNIASVGITRDNAKTLGLDARSAFVVAHDRADYYPGAKEIFLHLVYEGGTGRVLGVQGLGEGEVAKRIDIASQMIKNRATLEDFAGIEQAYSPPYSPAMEPLAVAAMVGLNQEFGLVSVPPDSPLEGTVIDVRHPEEREARPVPCDGSISAPLEDLRAGEFDLGEGPFLVVCEKGPRSCEAGRILQSRGATPTYLGGGLRWRRMMFNSK